MIEHRADARPWPGRLGRRNAQVGLRFLGDKLTEPGPRPIEDLLPGEGDIVRYNGQKVAGHRRDERSWDCPCHGSRFSPEGEVLDGSAVHGLERKPVE